MSAELTPQPDQIGPCRIAAKLGEGGMGVVFRGYHVELDLDVAIKVLHARHVSQPGAVERFLREARLAARLNHPGIVKVFGCGNDKSQYFIVMELVEGTSLRSLIEEQGMLSVPSALRIAQAVARALDEALGQVGLLHRDIKPDNILLTPGGQVKLADLGLAKFKQLNQPELTELTTPGVAIGTPRYMSPEQISDASSVDHRSDIFSLGATLYHMLSGRAPFDADSLYEILLQVAESDPAPLPEHEPVAVEALVTRMLEKNVNRRFQSYSELLDGFADVLGPLEAEVVPETREDVPDDPLAIPSVKMAGRVLRPASPSENRALLVVDIQNDFCPSGALAVPEGDQVVPTINDLARRFRHVILTQDWHCADHLSFATSHPGKRAFDRIELPYGPQVLWPDHCIQGTPGADFHADLKIPHAELVIRKGYSRDIDSYSAFFENDRRTPTGLAGYLRERGLQQLFIVGLATDFCVAYSALDARKLGFNVTVIECGCRGIDVDGSVDAAWEQMARAGVLRT